MPDKMVDSDSPPISKEESFELLKKREISFWNSLRKKYPSWKPDLEELDFSNLDLTDCNLSGAKLKNAKFTNSVLVRVNLKNASLYNVDGKKANFSDTDLRNTYMHKGNFTGANFCAAKMQKANLHEAILRNTNMWYAILNGAKMWGSDLYNSYCVGADFRYADIRCSDIRYATLTAANFEGASVREINYNRFTKEWIWEGRYQGIRVSTCHGSARFKRYAQDEDFVEEFKDSWFRFPIYLIWLILADCGRSLWPWVVWSSFFAVMFGIKLFSLGPDAFQVDHLPWCQNTMLYYSVVTFTTLGFGDIKPITLEAANWVMAEVIVGYVMLGGLVSILATKLARRS